MKILNYCNKIIEYSFYLLFFLVPLALTGDTSELFEFNKLWVTFIITIIIGAAWFTKMVVKKEIRLQRTPLDIPIALFLASQIISSIISLDMHTSLWGYYSRFNGGLFSIFAFVFLYYAFVTNLLTREEKEKETLLNGKQENKPYDFKKGALYIIGATGAFIVGILIATVLKPSTEAGIPVQMLTALTTSIISFAIFMKAAPFGVLKRSIYAIFASSLIVILWGLPSHFGYDPTCLLFRGTLDVSCWTADFHPKVRIFSTLGQPDWMAAYLGILIPILTAIYLNFIKGKEIINEKNVLNKNFLINASYFIFYILMYAAFMYTKSRTAIAGLWLSLILLFVFYFWFYLRPKLANKAKPIGLKILILLIFSTFTVTFFTGVPGGFPFKQVQLFTLEGIKPYLSKPQAQVSKPKELSAPTPTPAPTFSSGELGGTDSTKIRSFVWQGAISIWKSNPIFGTGLETYAFAYYMHKPIGHNMTSEWNYLYNKAHNEFLNYLATTGTVGIATYLSVILSFYYLSLKFLYKKRKNLSSNELLIFSFIMAYTVANITNFGGFSVVIVNIFFYLFPLLVFYLANMINYDQNFVVSLSKNQNIILGNVQKISTGVILIIAVYLIYTLIGYWNADRYYYFGYNYDRAGDYQKAYAFLKLAVDKRPGEPVFQDELAYNNAILGASLLAQTQTQKDANQQQNIQVAKQLIDSAITLENKVTSEHPNNIVFWKTKIRMLYTLSQLDQSYLPLTLEAIKKAAILAPTDPDISYNLGVLQGQTGDFNNAIATLQNTIKLKPDYKGGQAYYALAIFYHELSLDANGNVVNIEYKKRAIETLKYMIKYFGENQQALDALKAWEK